MACDSDNWNRATTASDMYIIPLSNWSPLNIFNTSITMDIYNFQYIPLDFLYNEDDIIEMFGYENIINRKIVEPNIQKKFNVAFTGNRFRLGGSKK